MRFIYGHITFVVVMATLFVGCSKKVVPLTPPDKTIVQEVTVITADPSVKCPVEQETQVDGVHVSITQVTVGDSTVTPLDSGVGVVVADVVTETESVSVSVANECVKVIDVRGEIVPATLKYIRDELTRAFAKSKAYHYVVSGGCVLISEVAPLDKKQTMVLLSARIVDNASGKIITSSSVPASADIKKITAACVELVNKL